MHLPRVACIFRYSYQETAEPKDLDRARDALQRVLLLPSPVKNPNIRQRYSTVYHASVRLRVSALLELNICSRLRWRSTTALADLDGGIAHLRECQRILDPVLLDLWSVKHRARFLCHVYLAMTLSLRFQQTGEGTCLQEAIESIDAITPSSWSRLGLEQIIGAKELVELLHNHSAVRSAFSEAQRDRLMKFCLHMIYILRSSYQGLGNASRLEVLKQVKELSNSVAQLALAFKMPMICLQGLEWGRALFWQQILRLRGPFDHLPRYLSSRLQRTSSKLVTSVTASDMHSDSVDKELPLQRLLSARFNMFVDAARRLEGFGDFLNPTLSSQPYRHSIACKGPIVILIQGRPCHAALVTGASTEPRQVVFPDITDAVLEEWVTEIVMGNVRAVASDARHIGRRLRRQAKQRQSLAEIWLGIVEPVMRELGLEVSSMNIELDTYVELTQPHSQKAQGRDRPRIWWCPTGKFSFLPLHAAGIFSGPTAESLSDYAVSSYTPTVDILVQARKTWSMTPSLSSTAQVLLAAAPAAPGQVRLPYALDEVTSIARTLPDDSLLQTGSAIGASTVRDVTDLLARATIVHLACHGRQDPDSPLSSGFFLTDGKLTISQMMRLKAPGAYFAFLSACESAAGDRAQPDETVHLAAAMMFMGFKSVVGTLW